jgi:hypothetical protein
MLMIKTQLEEHIFLMVHLNLMHMNFQRGKLELEMVQALLYGCTNIIGLNIVLRRMLYFALFATCSKIKKTRARGLMHLQFKIGEIGI